MKKRFVRRLCNLDDEEIVESYKEHRLLNSHDTEFEMGQASQS